MAKRGQAVSLDNLVAQISALDTQRKVLVGKLQAAVASWSGESPLPWTRQRAARKTGAPRKRRKMSKAARAKIAAAQRARWAKQKAAK